jgi:hypothetical protein
MFVVVEHIYETAEGARNSNLLYRQQNRVRSHNANNTYTCLTKFALRHFHPLKKGKGNKHRMQIQDSTLTRKKGECDSTTKHISADLGHMYRQC